jgi:GTP cyclohydrolase II
VGGGPAATLRSVEQAASSLRRGELVLIRDESGDILAQAAETSTAQSLARLQHLGAGEVCLILTAHRAMALELPINGHDILCVRQTDDVDLDILRRLVDPTHGALPDGHVVQTADALPGGSAVIKLTKIAKLLPAALGVVASRTSRAWDEAIAGDVAQVDATAIAGYAELAATSLQPVAEARLPIAVAENARIVGFRPADGSIEQIAVVVGSPADNQPALCRIHSECFTGDLLGSLRCDCGSQLQEALRLIGDAGHGVLLYLADEGRGIGLINKLRAYQLQDSGHDTLEANRQLGFEADERSFRHAVVMLRHLRIGRVRLLTNNPAKVDRLTEGGIEVVERVPHAMAANQHNQAYLETKAKRAGHHIALTSGGPAR